MSLGTGIVTATILVLLALGIVYTSKKKKWFLVGKVAGVVLLLLAIISGGFWGRDEYKNRPRVMTALVGVELDMSQADVKIELGAPANVLENDEDDDKPAAVHWFIGDTTAGEVKLISFEPDSAGALRVYRICLANPYLHRKMFGIGRYTPQATVLKKLGEPTRSPINEGGLTKSLIYDNYGVSFTIEKGSVKSICVKKPA